MIFRWTLSLILLSSLILHAETFYGSGVDALGSGGALVARVRSTSALFLNPANLAELSRPELAVNGMLVSQKAYYSNIGQSTWASEVMEEAAPFGAIAFPLGKLTLAAGYARTREQDIQWDNEFIGRYRTNAQAFSVDSVSIGLGWSFHPKWQIGLSALQNDATLSRSVVRPYGLPWQQPQPDRMFEVEHFWSGSGTANSFLAGITFKPRFGWHLALTYETGTEFDIEGHYASQLSPGQEDATAVYQEAFVPLAESETSFFTPDKIHLAFSLKSTVRTRVEFNLFQEDWQENQGQSWHTSDATSDFRTYDTGLPLEKVNGLSIGAEFRHRKTLTWWAGIGYRETLIKRENIHPGMPTFDQFHYSLGLTWHWDNHSLECAYAYTQYRDATVLDQEWTFNPALPQNIESNGQEGLMESQRHQLAIGYRYRFQRRGTP
jgi:long-subunit fatty acid transport protein